LCKEIPEIVLIGCLNKAASLSTVDEFIPHGWIEHISEKKFWPRGRSAALKDTSKRPERQGSKDLAEEGDMIDIKARQQSRSISGLSFHNSESIVA